MALDPGARLGLYEIRGYVGAGGLALRFEAPVRWINHPDVAHARQVE